MNRKVAFLTMENPAGFFISDQLACVPLAQLNWQVVEIPWNRHDVRWDDYAAVVIRSPWDYQQHCDKFLQVLQAIDQSTAVLLNGLDVVRWNISKTYLRQLEERGVLIVPTLWRKPLTDQGLVQAFGELSVDEIVVKPVIGANADDTFRLTRTLSPETHSQVLSKFRSRMALVQPFLPSVVEAGEYSLFYFGGQYSHAVLKRPAEGDFRVQEEHGGVIRPTDPEQDCLAAGNRAMAAIPFQTLYARADVARLASGQPAIMELELIEPSLYFPYDDQSPGRFAAAFDQMMHEHSEKSTGT